MSGVRVIIVDDEALARQLVRDALSGREGFEVVAECANGFEAVKAVAEHHPDLMFLDIQMPKLDGFEVLELIEDPPAVIFVTAYDEFALKAFEVHAIDYLLKPFGEDRLDAALKRARERFDASTPLTTPVISGELRAAARPDGAYLERIVIKSGADIHVVPVDRVDYIEAQDDYVMIRTGGKELLKQQTLGSLEAALDPGRFVRVHRSYLLNLERLVRVEPSGKDTKVAVLAEGSTLPVSRSGYRRLREHLDRRG